MTLPTVDEFKSAMVVYVGRLRGGLKAAPWFGKQPTPADALKALEVIMPVAEACRGNRELTEKYAAAKNSPSVDEDGNVIEPVPLIENCLCYSDMKPPQPDNIPWGRFINRAREVQKILLTMTGATE